MHYAHHGEQVTQQDLEDTFNPPFKSCIQKGRASGLMCSYNEVNGVPNCADPNLLTTIARNTWGFDGYVLSIDNAHQSMLLTSTFQVTV